jgi:PhoPQ-activated pathogenicity-related protein
MNRMMRRWILCGVACALAPTCVRAQSSTSEKAAVATATDFAHGSTALDEYVAKPDSTFAWKLVSRRDVDEGTILVIDLTSQTWRTAAEIDRPEWRHWLVITVPKGATSDTALLFIGGGRNGGEAPAGPSDRVIAVAKATKSVVAELGQVPNQPLVFRNDGRKRTEDDLVARSMLECLKSGDQTWLAQLPMTKSAVRAMDAVQAALKENGLTNVEKFVVAGGSKRGWTTWLTAAVDTRVVGIAPVVIDVLNVQKSMQNHHAAYGFWAQSLSDYQQQGLTAFVNSPFATMLFALVDPYSFRERLTMPKCIVNATGDQFFTPDSSKLYFDDLQGEKLLCYVPNADHSLNDTNALDTLIAFYASVVDGLRRPKVTWEPREDGAWVVKTDMPVEHAILWQATNENARDFRVESIGRPFTSAELTAEANGTYVATPPATPERGWTAWFVQLECDIGAPTPLRVTTPVWITPDTLPHAGGSSAIPAAAAAAP